MSGPGQHERDRQKFREDTERFWKDYDWEFEERFARKRANWERMEREHQQRKRTFNDEQSRAYDRNREGLAKACCPTILLFCAASQPTHFPCSESPSRPNKCAHESCRRRTKRRSRSSTSPKTTPELSRSSARRTCAPPRWSSPSSFPTSLPPPPLSISLLFSIPPYLSRSLNSFSLSPLSSFLTSTSPGLPFS